VKILQFLQIFLFFDIFFVCAIPTPTMAEQRETAADIQADLATASPATSPQPSTEGSIQYVDVSTKSGVKDIQPFRVDRRDPSSLEDWLYDFENELSVRDIPPQKWVQILKSKLPRAEVVNAKMLHSYEALRDAILKRWGPPDPWGAMLVRLYNYAP